MSSDTITKYVVWSQIGNGKKFKEHYQDSWQHLNMDCGLENIESMLFSDFENSALRTHTVKYLKVGEHSFCSFLSNDWEKSTNMYLWYCGCVYICRFIYNLAKANCKQLMRICTRHMRQFEYYYSLFCEFEIKG